MKVNLIINIFIIIFNINSHKIFDNLGILNLKLLILGYTFILVIYL